MNSGELFENAIREGHEEIFDLLLASTGAAGVPRDSLITATREGQTSIVRKLIDAGRSRRRQRPRTAAVVDLHR